MKKRAKNFSLIRGQAKLEMCERNERSVYATGWYKFSRKAIKANFSYVIYLQNRVLVKTAFFGEITETVVV
jgi:hypothetical protein